MSSKTDATRIASLQAQLDGSLRRQSQLIDQHRLTMESVRETEKHKRELLEERVDNLEAKVEGLRKRRGELLLEMVGLAEACSEKDKKIKELERESASLRHHVPSKYDA